jgi:hypothetical protein
MNKQIEIVKTKFGKFEIEESDCLAFSLSGTFTDSKCYSASYKGEVFANGFSRKDRLIEELNTANSFAIRAFIKLKNK